MYRIQILLNRHKHFIINLISILERQDIVIFRAFSPIILNSYQISFGPHHLLPMLSSLLDFRLFYSFLKLLLLSSLFIVPTISQTPQFIVYECLLLVPFLFLGFDNYSWMTYLFNFAANSYNVYIISSYSSLTLSFNFSFLYSSADSRRI